MGESFPVCSKGRRASAGARNLLCSEPFRIFFPAGLVVSVLGVSLWPAFYAGWLSFAPHEAHARLMVEGFFGAFVIGFMGTAMPRMISAPRLSRAELGMLGFLYLLSVASHLGGRVAFGDGFFLALLVAFVASMGARMLFLREDLPPPGFVLAGMGLVGAIAGVAQLLAGRVVPLAPFQLGFASLLLYEGFVLFAVLGAGEVIFARVLGVKRGEGAKAPAAWRWRATAALICGLVLWGSFAIESGGWVREGRILRALVAGVYLAKTTPLLLRAAGKGTLGFGLRVAVAMILAGMLAAALYPQYMKGFDHLLFVSGFGLVALTVASRVVLGHAERLDLAEGRSRPMQWIVWIVLLAAATRASADPLPQVAVSHHIYAAILWAAAAGTWAGWLFPKLRSGD